MIRIAMYVHWAGASGGGGGAEDMVLDEVRFADRSKIEYIFVTESAAGESVTLNELRDLGVPIFQLPERASEYANLYRQQRVDLVHVMSCGDVLAGYQGALDAGLPVVDVQACVAYSAGWERFSGTGLVHPVYLCNKHLEHGGGGNKNFRVIVGGVDVEKCWSNRTKAQDKEKWGLDPKKLVVGWFGRFDMFKQPFSFVDIANTVRDEIKCQFIMFGNGVDFGRTQWLSDVAHLDIKFPGFVRDKASAFNCMDVFCFPTWQEAFGRVMPEAMVAGVPIVTNNYPVCKELCEDAAIYVEGERQDPMTFHASKRYADAIISLLKDWDLRTSMGIVGRDRSIEYYDARRMSKEYENLYREILHS